MLLPKWGMTMREATIARWLKEPGDEVTAGEPLVEVETDKVAASVEAPVKGTLETQCAAVGDVVLVGAVVAVIADT